MKNNTDSFTASSAQLWDLCLRPSEVFTAPSASDADFAEEDKMFDLKDFCVREKQ